jgi:hypothetical protein
MTVSRVDPASSAVPKSHKHKGGSGAVPKAAGAGAGAAASAAVAGAGAARAFELLNPAHGTKAAKAELAKR